MQIKQISIPEFQFLAGFRESNKIGVNYTEFMELYLTRHKLHGIHVIYAHSRFTACLGKNSFSHVDCMELASFAVPVGK